MSIDLHVHSTASDGTVLPEELVAEALELRLKALAIADHDSVEGVPAALAAAEDTPLVVIPAIELSATAEDGRGMHVLGYRIDHTDRRLLERLRTFREQRRERAVRMIEALREGGYALSIEAVMAQAGTGALGRAHIARALADAGAVRSMGEAFRELIGHERPYFIEKPRVGVDEVIGIVRDAGGIAVLAHPGISRVDDLFDRLREAGLRGIEVWHSEHSPEDVDRYAAVARERGLLATGGSDYHGPSSSGGGKTLGCVDVPDSAAEELLAAPV